MFEAISLQMEKYLSNIIIPVLVIVKIGINIITDINGPNYFINKNSNLMESQGNNLICNIIDKEKSKTIINNIEN